MTKGKEKMSEEPKESMSQELPGVVDEGGMSFSVDSTPEGEVESPKEEVTSTSKEKDDEEIPAFEGEEVKEEGTSAPEEKTDAKEEEVPSKEEKKDGLPKGVRKQIDRLTRKRREAEREAEALRLENETLKKSTEFKKDIKDKPDIVDFDTEEEYTEALIDYRVSMALVDEKERQRLKSEEELKARQEAIANERHARIQREQKKASSKYDDFEDVIEDLKITDSMVQILEEMPNMGDIAYKLGKDPELVAEIMDMSIVEATLRIREVSEELKPKKITKTPAPLRPVSGTGGHVKSLDEMSYPEYRKAMEARDKERRGR